MPCVVSDRIVFFYDFRTRCARMTRDSICTFFCFCFTAVKHSIYSFHECNFSLYFNYVHSLPFMGFSLRITITQRARNGIPSWNVRTRKFSVKLLEYRFEFKNQNRCLANMISNSALISVWLLPQQVEPKTLNVKWGKRRKYCGMLHHYLCQHSVHPSNFYPLWTQFHAVNLMRIEQD